MKRNSETDEDEREIGVRKIFRCEVLEIIGGPDDLDDAEGSRDEEKIKKDQGGEDLFAGLDVDDGREDLKKATFRHGVS